MGFKTHAYVYTVYTFSLHVKTIIFLPRILRFLSLTPCQMRAISHVIARLKQEHNSFVTVNKSDRRVHLIFALTIAFDRQGIENHSLQ